MYVFLLWIINTIKIIFKGRKHFGNNRIQNLRPDEVLTRPWNNNKKVRPIRTRKISHIFIGPFRRRWAHETFPRHSNKGRARNRTIANIWRDLLTFLYAAFSTFLSTGFGSLATDRRTTPPTSAFPDRSRWTGFVLRSKSGDRYYLIYSHTHYKAICSVSYKNHKITIDQWRVNTPTYDMCPTCWIREMVYYTHYANHWLKS